MTREIKLALILGSALVLVVGVLISDHLSGARNARIAQVESDLAAPPVAARTSTLSEPERTGWSLPLGPSQAKAEPPAPAINNALADPNAALAQINDPTSAHLPGVSPESAPQLTASEQVTELMRMAQGEGVPLTYESPSQPAANPFIAPPTTANSQTSPISNPAASSEIVVRDGDTLWSLAETHLGSGAQFPKLLEANRDRIGADGGEIRVGTRLRLPASAAKLDTPASKPSTKPVSESSKPTKADKPGPRSYTVKKGDTLGSIASSQLGSAKRWKEIQDANPGLKPTDLRVGQAIKLPPK